MRSKGTLRFVLLTKYYSGDPMKADEMGGTCGTYEEKREMRTGFWWGNVNQRDNVQDLRIGRRIILKKTLKN